MLTVNVNSPEMAVMVARAKSALGHERTFAMQNVVSALPPKADISQHERNVCFVPRADSCSAAKTDG